MEKRSDGEIVETAREARGGFLGKPILTVLLISVVLAVIVLGVLWGGMFKPGT